MGGDHTLEAIRPPTYDSPATRALLDRKTAVYWASDAFATPVPGGADAPLLTSDVNDLDRDFWWNGMFGLHALSPWLSMVDSARFAATVDRVQRLDASTIVAAHSPTITGDRIDEVLALTRRLPGAEAPPAPDQPAAAEQGARGSTVVVHAATYTQSFPDDICGPRASEETVRIRTMVLHYTETDDGTFNVQFTETGSIHVDFDDPLLQDFDSQFTDSIHHVLTPSGTETFIETFHQVSGELKIWSRIQVRLVDGRLMFERETSKVTGCP